MEAGSAANDADALVRDGFGLDYHALRLGHTTEAWVAAGAALSERVAHLLGNDVQAVEPVGSASVLGLAAKPIVDLAVGSAADQDFESVRLRLEKAGWIYRGDAGDQGGQVFVLEARPWYRVAHIHAVEHGGRQWLDYLRLRDLLRRSPHARRRYEEVKVRLVEELSDDRRAYTESKSEIVSALLAETADLDGGAV